MSPSTALGWCLRSLLVHPARVPGGNRRSRRWVASRPRTGLASRLRLRYSRQQPPPTAAEGTRRHTRTPHWPKPAFPCPIPHAILPSVHSPEQVPPPAPATSVARHLLGPPPVLSPPAISTARDLDEALPRSTLLATGSSSRSRCPRCGGGRLLQWGSFSGRRRQRCRDCGRTFSDFTGTWLAHGKRPDLWPRYVECMRLGLTCRAAGRRLGIHKDTRLALAASAARGASPVGLAGAARDARDHGAHDAALAEGRARTGTDAEDAP